MKYIIGTAVIIGLSLYFFRDEFFVALGYIDQVTQVIAQWIQNK
jgi:hypothetical protein